MKVVKYLMYYLVTALYSVLIGFIAWSFLFVVNTVTHFLWIGHEGEGAFMYEHKLLIIPFIWGVSMILAYIYIQIMRLSPSQGLYMQKSLNKRVALNIVTFLKSTR